MVRLHLISTATPAGSLYIVFTAAIICALAKAIPPFTTRRAFGITVGVGIKVPFNASHD